MNKMPQYLNGKYLGTEVLTTALLVISFMLVSCLAHSSNLKMEVTCFPETSAYFQRTTYTRR
jgi:hypothetical protein